MLAVFRKEVNSFLSSLIGQITIIVFLLINGLFLWIFPTGFNILNYGYATLDNLFMLSPFVFLFLIPAVTMRTFADERKTGTFEIIMTRPVTDLQVITGKYLAGVVLVLLSILPTLVYFFSVYQLGSPVGNIDTGGTWGSFIGLLFLASGFVAIGTFCSSLTENNIVSFLLTLLISGFFYIGFDFIHSLSIFGSLDLFIKSLGINAHYTSMSRGVIDTRDVLYFLSLIAFFILLTKVSLESRKW
ncbi:MAG: gliding motility-associated ABC transporter permease subunit GldF [Bacteroidales bacterium]|nr:gliding motility-associated ABC transporter permease subunit GldF [Bacteroidales bacterium]